MKVGSLVECINANDAVGVKPLTLGDAYTIREIINYGHGKNIGVLLEEISNMDVKPPHFKHEPSYWIERFREIQPPMTINIEELISEPQTLEHATF